MLGFSLYTGALSVCVAVCVDFGCCILLLGLAFCGWLCGLLGFSGFAAVGFWNCDVWRNRFSTCMGCCVGCVVVV